MNFTAAQAARLGGCSLTQLRHWARSRLVVPSENGDRYTFTDLVALRVVRSLLTAGVPTARIRLAVNAIRESGLDVTSLRIVTDGRQVWACHDDGQILDALRHGQLALFVGVDQVAADLESAIGSFGAERAAFVEHLVAPRDAMLGVSAS